MVNTVKMKKRKMMLPWKKVSLSKSKPVNFLVATMMMVVTLLMLFLCTDIGAQVLVIISIPPMLTKLEPQLLGKSATTDTNVKVLLSMFSLQSAHKLFPSTDTGRLLEAITSTPLMKVKLVLPLQVKREIMITFLKAFWATSSLMRLKMALQFTDIGRLPTPIISTPPILMRSALLILAKLDNLDMSLKEFWAMESLPKVKNKRKNKEEPNNKAKVSRVKLLMMKAASILMANLLLKLFPSTDTIWLLLLIISTLPTPPRLEPHKLERLAITAMSVKVSALSSSKLNVATQFLFIDISRVLALIISTLPTLMR
mmetsp:Transcript_16463/g.14187  ORF Transcript_16463/g.14187 Transcript_16463/m.14187 type:complete len:313 (-) Transcript_16463:2238-3176(-)